jgi:asparagine synthetase B (glutamine-hydrolysing)
VLAPAARKVLGRSLSRRLGRASELTRTPWVESRWYHSHTPYFSNFSTHQHQSVTAKLIWDWYHLGSTTLWHGVNRQLAEKSGAQFLHPFFDARLIEFMLRVPPHLLMRRGENKVIARQAMKNVLPESIVHRLDSRPASESITHGLKQIPDSTLSDIFSNSLLASNGFIKSDLLQKHYRLLMSGNGQDYQPVVNSITAELWLRYCKELQRVFRKERPSPHPSRQIIAA